MDTNKFLNSANGLIENLPADKKLEIVNYLLSVFASLNGDEKIEINMEGKIKIIWYVNGQKKSRPLGSLFDNINQFVPVKVKPWVNIPGVAIKSFHDFGKKLPHNNKKSESEVFVMAEIFEALVDLDSKFDIVTDSNSFTYKVYTVGDYKGYYNKNMILRFIEYKGKKRIVPQKSPSINTMIFKK